MGAWSDVVVASPASALFPASASFLLTMAAGGGMGGGFAVAAQDSTSNSDSDSERPSLWEGWCLLWMFRVGTDAAGTRQWRVCGKHCIAKQGLPSASFWQDVCNPLRLQLLKRDTHHGRPGCNLGLGFVCWLDCNVVFSVCQVMCFGVRKRQHVAGLLLIYATCAPWLSQSTHHHPSQLQADTC